MQLPSFIARLLEDPPPRYVFELSEAGIAVARNGRPPQIGFQPLEPDVIAVSPVKDNVLRPEALLAQVQALAPRGEKKRQRAVLILPDYSVRVSVLDFDAFPTDPAQQLSLVRFRVKKSLPFDIDSACVSYHPQPGGQDGKRWDVVVAVTPLEILARYEAPFRGAGFHPGLVTTSALCALELMRGGGVSVLAKLSGWTLTLAVAKDGILKLLRTLELSEGGADEIASHLYPTFAYIEDQLAAKAGRVLLCGLGSMAERLRREFGNGEGPVVEPLRSRYGAPHHYNAGLLGYLETIEEALRK
jgi:type IV pilus assembly protein PilM